jgi:hypothetical protein
MYLNALGISKNKHDQLIPFVFRDDDVSAEDLGGKLVDLALVPEADRNLFVGFRFRSPPSGTVPGTRKLVFRGTSDSTPNPEFEKVLSGCAVIQELIDF